MSKHYAAPRLVRQGEQGQGPACRTYPTPIAPQGWGWGSGPILLEGKADLLIPAGAPWAKGLSPLLPLGGWEEETQGEGPAPTPSRLYCCFPALPPGRVPNQRTKDGNTNAKWTCLPPANTGGTIVPLFSGLPAQDWQELAQHASRKRQGIKGREARLLTPPPKVALLLPSGWEATPLESSLAYCQSRLAATQPRTRAATAKGRGSRKVLVAEALTPSRTDWLETIAWLKRLIRRCVKRKAAKAREAKARAYARLESKAAYQITTGIGLSPLDPTPRLSSAEYALLALTEWQALNAAQQAQDKRRAADRKRKAKV